MNKRLVIIGILFLAICVIAKLLYVICKNIKVDDFHKAAIIFVVDSSASNQKMLPLEIKYLKSLMIFVPFLTTFSVFGIA